MRRFYVLAADPKRSDLQSVKSYNLGGLSLHPLWRGDRVSTEFPTSCRIVVTNKQHADLLGNPLSLIIVSDRVLSRIQKLVSPDEMQILSPPIFNETTNEAVPGYYLLNCLRTINALSPDCTEAQPMIDQIVIKESLVPKNTNLFRLGGQTFLYLISEELFEELSGKGLQGMMAIHTETCA